MIEILFIYVIASIMFWGLAGILGYANITSYGEYRDGWIGYYWDHKDRIIYICLLPYMVIKIWLPK